MKVTTCLIALLRWATNKSMELATKKYLLLLQK